MDAHDEMGSRLADLTRRVDAAESIQAIQALKARYAAVVDARFVGGQVVDANRLAELSREAASLFTAHGTWDGGPGLGVARGRSEIAARLAEPTLIFSRHLFVNPQISVDGDRATGRWDLLCPCTRPDGTALWMSGYEVDTYNRVDGVWLHDSMTLTTVFIAPAGEGWPKILA